MRSPIAAFRSARARVRALVRADSTVIDAELFLAMLSLEAHEADALAKKHAALSWLMCAAAGWGIYCMYYAARHLSWDLFELPAAGLWTALVLTFSARSRWLSDQLRARKYTPFRLWLTHFGDI